MSMQVLANAFAYRKSFEECKHFRDMEFVLNDAIHVNNKLLLYSDS